jgi:hypothetical protein
MPFLTKTFAIVAGLISVPVFGFAVIGANYQGVILEHLTDIVNGNQTTTVVGTNAPNWSTAAVPLAVPTVTSIATTSAPASSLASSTAYTFAVTANDQNGATIISNSLTATTDASSTLMPDENILVSWSAIAGAQGYRVYFATGTVASFTQYFNATTSGSYNFSTSTGSITGSLNSDTTAFSTKINPQGPSYVNGNNGTATTTVASTTALEINGNVRAQSAATTSACYAATAGQVFYNTANSHEWGCNGTSWKVIF